MRLKNCDIYELKKKVQDKKLVCFGKGKVLRDFLEDFKEFEFEKNIYAIADNNIDKNERNMMWNGHHIPLIHVQDILHIKDEIIILISCADIFSVYKQLNQYTEISEVSCYVVYFVRSQTNKVQEQKIIYPDSFRITKKPLIPKIIHYCWFGKNSIPERNLKWMESWKYWCPDYKIMRWDQDNYDVTKNAYMYEAFEKEKWSFVSDYVRCDVVYQYGGIYLDTDVELIRSYDELLYQPAFCGIEGSRKIALGLGFGAIKSHPLIKEILDMYDKIDFIDENGSVNLTTCVQLQHPIFLRNGFVNNGDYQIINGMTVYPEAVLSPKDVYTGEIDIKKNTFSIHHYEGTWVDEVNREKADAIKELYRKVQY